MIRRAAERWRKNAASLMGMPPDLFILLALECLGALGAQLAGAGRYQLMLNEYDMDEIEASSLAGIASYIHLVSGIATAPLVDLVGIRTMALASIVLSIVLDFLTSLTPRQRNRR